MGDSHNTRTASHSCTKKAQRHGALALNTIMIMVVLLVLVIIVLVIVGRASANLNIASGIFYSPHRFRKYILIEIKTNVHVTMGYIQPAFLESTEQKKPRRPPFVIYAYPITTIALPRCEAPVSYTHLTLPTK